jgi:site-specific recombinase XerD
MRQRKAPRAHLDTRQHAALVDHDDSSGRGWRETGIPKALPAGHVALLLDNCDHRDPVQVRDHAILLLVARLGLRSIEVARL